MSDCLILNTDGAPVSHLPLSVINWQEAIKYMVLDKAVVLAWHDDWIVHSQTWGNKGARRYHVERLHEEKDFYPLF